MAQSKYLRPTGPKRPAKGHNRTLYVPDSDQEVWEAAHRYAQAQRVSLSSLVTAALARFLADAQAPAE